MMERRAVGGRTGVCWSLHCGRLSRLLGKVKDSSQNETLHSQEDVVKSCLLGSCEQVTTFPFHRLAALKSSAG